MCTTLPSWLFYKIFINNVEFFMSRAWIGLLAFQTRCLRSFSHFVLLRFLVFDWVTLYSLGHCQQWRENWWVSVFFNNAAHDRQFASIILLPVGDFNLEITLISVSINFLFLNNRLWFYMSLPEWERDVDTLAHTGILKTQIIAQIALPRTIHCHHRTPLGYALLYE